MAARVPKTTLMGLWKQGWLEIPEVMGSSIIGVIGIAIGLVGLNKYYKDDGDNRRYKKDYIVYRSDDPRVKDIKQ